MVSSEVIHMDPKYKKEEVRMEDMGMTNEQWYADIRNQIDDREDVRELVQQTARPT